MISVVGTSGSGKTATIEYLTAQLTKLGFIVGVAKHIHKKGFTIDTEGKDTWKHARAGARIVIASSPNEIATIKKTTKETELEEITKLLGSQELDIAFLEGFSAQQSGNTAIRKIVAAKNQNDLRSTLNKTQAPILAITGRIARTRTRLRKTLGPLVDVHGEGPVLTTMIRRLIRPKEIREILKDASVRHGGVCIGLAIGVRAAYIASSAFGQNPHGPQRITCGTKHCIAEAFRTLYPKSRVEVLPTRNDRITLNDDREKLVIQLAQKRKFTGINEVLTVPDSVLFDSVRFMANRGNRR